MFIGTMFREFLDMSKQCMNRLLDNRGHLLRHLGCRHMRIDSTSCQVEAAGRVKNSAVGIRQFLYLSSDQCVAF